MHRSNLQANTNIWQIIVDFSLLAAAFFVSYAIASQFTRLYDIGFYVWILVVFIPTWMFIMHSLRMYDRTTFLYTDRLVRCVLLSTLAASIIIAAMFYFIKETNISRILFGMYAVCTVALLTAGRLVTRSMNRNLPLLKKGSGIPRVVIAGTPQLSGKFRKYLAKTNVSINILGFLQIYRDQRLKKNYHLGYLEDLEEIVKKHVIDEVIFALPRDYVGELEPYILLCEEMGITVRMVVNLYDLKYSRTHLSSIGTLPVLTFHTVTINKVNLLIKRAIDIVGSLIGLLLTAVISIAVIIAIKLESPGPAIFTQERVGLNGRKFKIYKFRSMYIDAEERKEKLMQQNRINGGFMFKIEDDPRITKVGKFLRRTSIDELPQFFNVLKGDMSLVGTRPPTVDEVSRYAAHHRKRLSFKPGLTGLWQVSGRSNITNFDEVVRLDTSYIAEWSLWLDIRIMLKTVRMLLSYKSGAM